MDDDSDMDMNSPIQDGKDDDNSDLGLAPDAGGDDDLMASEEDSAMQLPSKDDVLNPDAKDKEDKKGAFRKMLSGGAFGKMNLASRVK